MTDIELFNESKRDRVESIVEMDARGENATQIARRLNLPRKDVIHLLKEYRDHLQVDAASRDFAKDMLYKMIEHYNMLIKDSYKLKADLEDMNLTHQVAGQIVSIIRTIGDFEAKRMDIIQKAGILDAHDLTHELDEMERDKQIVLDILRNHLCSTCRPEVMRRIGEISGRVEVVVVDE